MTTGFTNPIGLSKPILVNQSGTGNSSVTSYAPIIGGSSPTTSLASANSGISNAGYVLTSTGSSSAPTWQLSVGIGSFSSIVVTTLNPGSSTYTPTSGMVYVMVEVMGGGGSGGGDTNYVGGGGGAGGYARAFYSAADIGASQSYSVGTGGAASSSGNDGNTSWFISNVGSGTYLVGTGGKKGTKNTQSTGFTGLFTYSGGNGGQGEYGGSGSNFLAVSGGAGYYGIYAGGTFVTGSSIFTQIGGQGGSSFLSNLPYVIPGIQTTTAGSQGGGGQGSGGIYNGSPGGNGFIICTEFIA